MDTGLPGKYSYYGDSDRRNKTIKVTRFRDSRVPDAEKTKSLKMEAFSEVPSVLEHHRQGHPALAPPTDPRRKRMRSLYKFGLVGLICFIFILVIVLTSILSTDGGSKNGGPDSSTYEQQRKFSCFFVCDNPSGRDQLLLSAEEAPSLESTYNKKIRKAFKNTTLRPYLDGVEFVGIDENESHSTAMVDAILIFINSSEAQQFLNAEYIADVLRSNVDCARKETVNVTEIGEPTTHTTEAPTTQPNVTTVGPTSIETTQGPPAKNYTVFPLLPFCNGHGWSETCYPNYLGYKTPEEATASLSFFQIITQQNCHHHIQYFSCALLQPQCSRTEGRVPICKPFCEGVKDSCWEMLRLTEIGRKDLCGLSNANYGPQCSQVCSASDFICEKTKMCIGEKRRCDARLDCGPGDLSDELNCTCKPNQFRCSNGMCIKGSLRCNNVNDCGEWEDEIGCGMQGWRNCSRTGQCFPSSAWCDKKFDCADHSDETECLCAPNEYRCQNGLCRPAADRCNGINDCGDFSDEFDCTCEADQFLCDKHLCKYYANDWCNGKKDCADGTDEPVGCKCKPGQYKCDDGTCIPEHRACDRLIDCPDGSDERHCKCSPLEFECEPGHCIPLEQVCDGLEQCPNKADELQNCECPISTHFRCNNGQCLPITRYCNFISDCPDKEDEGDDCSRTCPAGYAFKCILRKTTEYTCLPAEKVCDGVPDCDRKEDETNCGECKKDQFRCGDGTCVPFSAYCNGVHDCVDLSDEKNCTCNPSFQFSCDDGWCYMKAQRCDGVAQCADLSDESQCSCAELLSKQHPERICDQVADCQDQSDESNCDNVHSPAGAFICYAGRAIDVSKVCDGKKDCPLGDDERHCVTLVGNFTEDLKRYWEFRDTGTVYFRHNGIWAPVCALTNDTERLIVTAQHVCAQNLYQTVANIAMVAWNRSEAMYMPLSNYTSSQTLAPPSKECDSGQVLYVKCSHQTCGDNPYNLGEKSHVASLGSNANTLPFFVSIYSDRTHKCAGSLLGKMWVLTTASCLDATNEKTLTVRTGIQRNSSLSPYDQFSPVGQQLKHSMYSGRPGGPNDIALLRLAVPLTSTPMAQPVCLELMDVDDDVRSTKAETAITFTLGMGRLRRKKISADYPDLVELTITNTSTCRRNRIVRLETMTIAKEQFCAFEQPESYRCQGESGSPILTKRLDKWHLIGLTSKPHSCTSRIYPSIYTNVTYYAKWVEHAADVLHAQKPNLRRCENGMFSCLLGDCIDASAVCDGIRNCAFGEDEKCEEILSQRRGRA